MIIRATILVFSLVLLPSGPLWAKKTSETAAKIATTKKSKTTTRTKAKAPKAPTKAAVRSRKLGHNLFGLPPSLALPLQRRIPARRRPIQIRKKAARKTPKIAEKAPAAKATPRPRVAAKRAQQPRPVPPGKPAKSSSTKTKRKAVTKPANTRAATAPAATPTRKSPLPRKAAEKRKAATSALPLRKRPTPKAVAPLSAAKQPTSRPIKSAKAPKSRASTSRQPADSRPVVATPRKRPRVQNKPPTPRWKPQPKHHPPVNAKAVMYLQPGTKTTQLGVVGHTNWFGLRVQESGWYVLQTKGRADTYCALFNPSFRRLSKNDDAGERRNCRIIRRFEPGNYLFEVMLLPSGRTQYTLSFHRINTKHLVQDQVEKARLAWPGDLHLYEFQITSVGQYKISTTGKADTVCQLLTPGRPDAIAMARDDDSGVKRNCAINWHFHPGNYTLMLTGSYVGRGPYQIRLGKATTPGVKFKVMKFGVLQRDILKGPNQAHRFRFTLKKPSRLTFMAALHRATPQMIVRNDAGTPIPFTGHIAKLRGRFWIHSQWLQKGDYDLELRAAGKPRGAYMLVAHIENDVLLPANRARPLANGFPKTPGKTAFQHALFRIALDGRHYNVLEGHHPKLLACYLETLDGQQIAMDYIPNRRRRPCRLPTTRKSGIFLFRVLFLRASYKARKRLSKRERLLRRRRSMREYLRRLRRRRLERRYRRNYRRHFRRLFRPPPRLPERKRAPNHRAAPPKQMLLSLVNQWKGPTVRMLQVSLALLPMNKSKSIHRAGPQLFQVNVPKADLYWFSSRGKHVRSCRVERLFAGNIKQSQLANRGCDVAVYLQRGSYLFRVEARQRGKLTLSWRPYRSTPKVLGRAPIVVGPVAKGQTHKHQLRIRRAGFYRLDANVASSVPLKTKSTLKRGSRVIARSSARSSQITSFLSKGTYQVEINIVQGRGAYSLRRKRMPSLPLALGKHTKARLKGYNDAHFFSLHVKRNGRYRFETKGALDTICTMYNASNRRIARNDDSGSKRNCRLARYLRAGRYSIKVRNLTRKMGTFIAGYKKVKSNARLSRRMRRLRLLRRWRRLRRRRRAGRLGKRRNANGRQITRRAIIGRRYSATLRNKRDRHYYNFRIRSAGRYSFVTTGPSARTDTKCSLYKGKRLIARNDDGGWKLHCKINKTLAPGRYRLTVVLALSSRAGPYRLVTRRIGAGRPGRAITSRRRRLRRLRRLARRHKRAKVRRVPRARRGRTWLGNIRTRTARTRVAKTPKAKKNGNVRPAVGLVLRPGLRSQAMPVNRDRTDLYTVNIPAAGTYIIETDGPLDTKCYLDDAQGGVVVANDDGGDAVNCRIQARLPFGTYQLRVSIRTAGRFGPYGVSLRRK